MEKELMPSPTQALSEPIRQERPRAKIRRCVMDGGRPFGPDRMDEPNIKTSDGSELKTIS